jgi:hypothetical protein
LQNRGWTYIPLIGIPIFVLFYFAATLYYPGGSHPDHFSRGFSWTKNYWCNLIDYKALNGEINPARPIARSAMIILCLSLGVFWNFFPQLYSVKIWVQSLTRFSGLGAMLTGMFLGTLNHDWVINVTSLLGSIGAFGLIYITRKLRWQWLYALGLVSIGLTMMNRVIYDTELLWKYLPIIQKLTFVSVLLWIWMLALRSRWVKQPSTTASPILRMENKMTQQAFGTSKVFPIALLLVLLLSWSQHRPGWEYLVFKKYTFYYTSADSPNNKEYIKLIDNGIKDVEQFFGYTYKNKFAIYVHPDRSSLDSAWQHDWNMPTFKSQCWMVASGIASKLDLISPKAWDKVACDHKYSERKKTQDLINHELVHVLHGQSNESPDFSNVENIDWFVEGLATYASGQCDTARIDEIKKAINEKKVPQSLDHFWEGNLKYGLSGSVAMYIDHNYGRRKLKELLPFNKKTEILQALNVTESKLLEDWSIYIIQL